MWESKHVCWGLRACVETCRLGHRAAVEAVRHKNEWVPCCPDQRVSVLGIQARESSM